MRSEKEIAETLERIKKSKRKFEEDAKRLNLFENYLFASTYGIYEDQIDIMESLLVEIKLEGVTVEKTYRKGEANTYINPAVAEFNKYASAANGTAKTLNLFLKPADGKAVASDPFIDFVRND